MDLLTNPDFEPSLRDLYRALRRLDPGEQGRQARANARAAVKAATRRLLAAMDRRYPVVRKARKAKASVIDRMRAKIARLTAKKRKLHALGWEHLAGHVQVHDLAVLGIRVRSTGNILWVPGWVNRVEDTATLARLKRGGRRAQEAYCAEVALRNMGGQP